MLYAARVLRRREIVGLPSRVDPGLIEDLVGDPVADAGEETLVEKNRLDRGGPCAEALLKNGGGGKPVERVVPELRKWRSVGGFVSKNDPAEPAGVGHRDLATVVKSEPDLPELRWPHPCLALWARPEAYAFGVWHDECSAHAEVKDRVGP